MNVEKLIAEAGMANGAIIAQAAEDAGVELAVALAIAERETKGQHVYGHDTGGMFSTAAEPVTIEKVVYPKGYWIPVTRKNFLEFETQVMAGKRSNGIGIFQITYAGALKSDGTRQGGYLKMARDLDFDLSDPLSNARFALECVIAPDLKGRCDDDAILYAATKYNAGSWKGVPTAYGIGVLDAAKRWRTVLAEADDRKYREARRHISGLMKIATGW